MAEMETKKIRHLDVYPTKLTNIGLPKDMYNYKYLSVNLKQISNFLPTFLGRTIFWQTIKSKKILKETCKIGRQAICTKFAGLIFHKFVKKITNICEKILTNTFVKLGKSCAVG
jgi:hypothetical protein